ncbi:SH3 domain-containing protein [Hasllibacter sp. MH4015]|uniref:SH3 domain-containing protein n=1 Tax=Hasllibacter sp. MH4015 TaxID=2854029 RepID=UPI001CD636E4|nr:SH3 domain-containing protein [Hasllibacter sp. MH4015]
MIRLTVLLVAAIYVTMIVVPGEDHGVDIQVTSSASRSDDPIVPGRTDTQGAAGWIQSLIASAEAGASTVRAAPISQRQVVTGGSALIADDAGDLMLATATGEFYMIDAVINPVDLMDDDGRVTNVTVAALADPVEIETAVETQAADTTPEIWRVAARAVNFREGPSTSTNVLTSLRRGDEVEFLAVAADDSDWAHLRIVGSGIEGYMAAEFLEPVN